MILEKRNTLGSALWSSAASRKPVFFKPQPVRKRYGSSSTHPRSLPDGDEGERDSYSEAQASQEKFVDVSEVLRDIPEDHVYDGDDEVPEEVWVHEARFARDAEDAQPSAQIKGALDPDQADILSAYSTEQGFREVNVHYAAYHMQDSPQVDVIDVRTPSEFQTGHIAGSRNICLDDLSQAVKDGKLTGKKPLAIICARGGRSAQACVRLSKVFGFESVTNIAGGMNSWIGKYIYEYSIYFPRDRHSFEWVFGSFEIFS